MNPTKRILKFSFIDPSNISTINMRLNVTWAPELAQDLSTFHNIDVESELTTLLTDNLMANINLEILNSVWGGIESRLPTVQPLGQPSGVFFYMDYIYNTTMDSIVYDNEAWSYDGYFESPIGIKMDIKKIELAPKIRRSRRVVT